MEHERFARQADGRLQERSDFMERPSDNMAHTAQERSDSTHEATAHTVSARHTLLCMPGAGTHCRSEASLPGTHYSCPGSEATGTHCRARGEGACPFHGSFGPRTTASGRRSDL